MTWFFECLQLTNLLSKKFMRKIIFLKKCFLYIFCFRTFPLKLCLFDLLQKKYQKSKSPGHVRPRSWKSCHPREEKSDLPYHGPLVLTWCMQLFVTASCVWRGRERALDMATTSPKLKCYFN